MRIVPWQLNRLGRPFALVGVLAIAATTIGFAVSNTVPASKAGDGTGAVSGYTITNITYTLNATNSDDIDLVEFDLDTAPAAGANIELRLDSTGGVWYACTNVVAAIDCITTVGTQATVLATDQVRVVVTD